MNKILLSLLLISQLCVAGLPPTTSKISGDSGNVTTFNYQFPNFTGTHTGTTVSINNPAPFPLPSPSPSGAIPYANGSSAYSLSSNLIFDSVNKALKINSPTTTAGALNIKALGAGITSGFNLDSPSANQTFSLELRDTGDLFFYNGSVVFFSNNGALNAVGNNTSLTHFESNYPDSSTSVSSPSVYPVVAARNTDSTAGNTESVLFEDADVTMGGVTAVNDSHTVSAQTSHLSIGLINSGTYGEKAQITNTGIGYGVGAPGQSLDVSGTARLRGFGTAGVVLNSATGLLSSSAGPLSVANGGLGTGAATATGQIPIATSGGPYTPAFLGGTAAQVKVTNASGSITLGLGDSSNNVISNGFIPGYATTVTAAGTTTLTVASSEQQYFTGTTTQTVVLPVTSTLTALGQSFVITNNSTGNVTVQSSGGNTVMVLGANTTGVFTCILLSGTTVASWNGTLVGAGGANNPTVSTALNSGSATGTGGFVSGTYTTPANVTFLEVELVGGGGGGAGGGNGSGGGTGGTGGTTTFGSSLLTASGGVGGAAQSAGGVGGTATVNSPAVKIAELQGGYGNPGWNTSSVVNEFPAGGNGASSPLGGAGGGGTSTGAGLAATPNTGSGGGGGGAGSSSANNETGSGGGAGGYIKAIIYPTAGQTFSYSTGAAGTAGTAGTGASAGGAGGLGAIRVIEHYANGAVGTATNVTGVVAVANGGTGQSHGAVVTNGTGAFRTEYVSFSGGANWNATACTSGTCTVNQQSSAWATPVRSSAGVYTIAVSPAFSATPTCTCGNLLVGVGNGTCLVNQNLSSGSSLTLTAAASTTGSNTDSSVNLICMGPQ